MREAESGRRAIGPRTTWAGLIFAPFGLATLPGVGAADVPLPAPGRGPQAVVAVLDYNRNVCDAVAGRVILRWRNWGASEQTVKKLRDYLVNHELSELAAARAASDITRSLLDQARAETGAETASSLERLTELVGSLCDTVAWPTAGREDFEAAVRGLLDRIESEEEELGSLLVVTEEEKKAALDPYLTPIQLAGVEAQSEYLDYLESLKPRERGPTLPELMQAWHRRYTAATAPTKEALGRYLEARGRNDSRKMATACKDILGAVIPVLRDGEVFKLPVRLVPASRGIAIETYPPLRQAYDEIRELAVDCSAGRSREVIDHFNEMQRQLQIAARSLAKYSLAP